jgi:DNA-binding transcriptional ArsR family regulator
MAVPAKPGLGYVKDFGHGPGHKRPGLTAINRGALGVVGGELLEVEVSDHAADATAWILRDSPNYGRGTLASMGTDYVPVARLLAAPARSAVVDALMAGKPLAAGELAHVAGVSASTVSEHLAELVDGGLLTVVSAGRHRYYQLASSQVATALEALSLICPDMPVRSLRQSVAADSMRFARLCYDHVAGVVGVALLDQMLAAGWVISGSGKDFEITEAGSASLAEIGVSVERCRKARRHFARSCLDWSERRPHLAGAVGAGLAAALVERKWLRKMGNGRALAVAEAGVHGLSETFKISVPDLTALAIRGGTAPARVG